MYFFKISVFTFEFRLNSALGLLGKKMSDIFMIYQQFTFYLDAIPESRCSNFLWNWRFA